MACSPLHLDVLDKPIKCAKPERYLIVITNENDWVYEDGYPVRIKRKYGRFDRSNAFVKFQGKQ